MSPNGVFFAYQTTHMNTSTQPSIASGARVRLFVDKHPMNGTVTGRYTRGWENEWLVRLDGGTVLAVQEHEMEVLSA